MIRSLINSTIDTQSSRLGTLLVGRRLISQAQLVSAVQTHRQTGQLLGQVLISQGAINSRQLSRCLQWQKLVRAAMLVGAMVLAPLQAVMAGGCSSVANECGANGLQVSLSQGYSELLTAYNAEALDHNAKQWNLSGLDANNDFYEHEPEHVKLSRQFQSYIAQHTSPLLVKALKGEHKGGVADNVEGVGYKVKWSRKGLKLNVSYNF